MQKRTPHALNELKQLNYPKYMLFFDCESIEEQISEKEKRQTLRFLQSCYIDRRKKNPTDEWRFFRSKEDFAVYVASKVKKSKALHIFAHNIYYDLKVSGLLRLLTTVHNYEIKSVFHNGHGLVIRLKHKKERKTIYLIDTFNYFPFSLKKIGESIGLEKLDVDVFTEDEKLLREYNRRDVEIIKEAVLQLIDFLQQEGIPFAYTTASLSFKAYRTKFLKRRIWIHANPEIDQLEKESYYGGRCEAFVINQELTAYKLDINSMYPFVMQKKLPYNLVQHKKGESIERLRGMLKGGYLAIARVKLDAQEPAFPYRTKQKLLFPTGRFTTTLATPELQYALEQGYIVEIEEVAYYQGDYILKDYVNYFYQKRIEAKQRGDDVKQMFYKLLLNSLYGKFAQFNNQIVDEYESEKVDFRSETAIINDKVCRVIHLYNKVFILERDKEPSFNSFIAIASHITSYARIYLWQLIKTAGAENVYYCDTDSIFCNEKGYERLSEYIDNKELGKLKLEEVGKCIIWGAKNYLFNNTRKLKGIPKNAKFDGEGYVFWTFEKFRGGLRKNRNDDSIILTEMKRRLVSPYDKRIVKEDGSTEPILLNEF